MVLIQIVRFFAKNSMNKTEFNVKSTLFHPCDGTEG